jgi:hypothetical protein
MSNSTIHKGDLTICLSDASEVFSDYAAIKRRQNIDLTKLTHVTGNLFVSRRDIFMPNLVAVDGLLLVSLEAYGCGLPNLESVGSLEFWVGEDEDNLEYGDYPWRQSFPALKHIHGHVELHGSAKPRPSEVFPLLETAFGVEGKCLIASDATFLWRNDFGIWLSGIARSSVEARKFMQAGPLTMDEIRQIYEPITPCYKDLVFEMLEGKSCQQ